jgi:hypothetical protein
MIKHHRGEFGALNCPLLCRLTGPLDAGALQVALDGLTARHESLRTVFSGRGARLVQGVHAPRPLPLTTVDLAPDGPGGTAAARGALDGLIAAELGTPIDPAVWPARATLWRLDATESVLCLNLHHLVTDAWSTGILLQDLSALYGRAVTGEGELPPAGWPYARFAEWQQSLLRGDNLARHRQYWRQELAGVRFPRLSPPGAARTPVPGTASAAVDPRTVARLRALAPAQRTTMFVLLLTVLHVHLYTITGQPDVAVASMFANRSRPELRQTVGLLANMVLLRSRLSTRMSFVELVRGVHAAAIGALAYQDLPLQTLAVSLDDDGRRADDVVFNMMAEVEYAADAAGVGFELLVPEDIGSRFRFELALVPVGPLDLRIVLFHTREWFDDAGAAAFLAEYGRLAALLTTDPDAPIGGVLAARTDA